MLKELRTKLPTTVELCSEFWPKNIYMNKRDDMKTHCGSLASNMCACNPISSNFFFRAVLVQVPVTSLRNTQMLTACFFSQLQLHKKRKRRSRISLIHHPLLFKSAAKNFPTKPIPRMNIRFFKSGFLVLDSSPTLHLILDENCGVLIEYIPAVWPCRRWITAGWFGSRQISIPDSSMLWNLQVLVNLNRKLVSPSQSALG